MALWAPGESRPEFATLAEKVAGRGRGCARRAHVVVAKLGDHTLWSKVERLDATSREGMSRFVSVAELYLGYLRQGSANAEFWTPWTTDQGAAPDDETLLPDAVVPLRDGGRLAIKYAGRYSALQFESLHDFCADRGLAYDVR